MLLSIRLVLDLAKVTLLGGRQYIVYACAYLLARHMCPLLPSPSFPGSPRMVAEQMMLLCMRLLLNKERLMPDTGLSLSPKAEGHPDVRPQVGRRP